MNPSEKSRAATSCSDMPPSEPAMETLCWLEPKFPKAVRSRTSASSGGCVMMLMAPATASEPYMVEPEPLNTSTRAMAASGTGISMSWCPDCESFSRSPFSSTSVWLHKSVITALGLKWCDVPHEREARIVSKRAAENLLGSEVVGQHIDAKIAEFITKSDADDWKCIQELTTSDP